MKTPTRILTLAFACALLLAGCDNLNLEPRDELGSDAVWQDQALTEAYLNDIYSGTGTGYSSGLIAGMVDEGKATDGSGGSAVRLSNMTPSEHGKWALDNGSISKFHWEVVYGQVRNINIFLREVSASEAYPEAKETLLGEAYFLRAFFYHNIMRLYGGVPLIAGTFDLSGDLEQYQVPRNTFAETVGFITADLDSAAARLSPSARRQGAATQGAAMALKCRVLVHAASDLFAENPSGMAETGYAGGSQAERWQAAKTACQAVMDLGQYSLKPAPTAEAYHQLFTKGNESGTIWARYFVPSGGEDQTIPMWVSPNGYNSWSGETPLQQHVDAYEMADGSEFEWQGGDPTSSEDPVEVENPYENRDPRFYANIHYNGASWRPRPEGLQELDPKGVIQTGWYEMPEGGMRPGLDTREGPVQVWNGTKTGYNLRKFVDRDIVPDKEQAYNPWLFLRYAEVLLNYAEASANLGDTEDALRALNQVRARAGMPDVPSGGGPARTLMERIRQEREVELAYEEFRYFDVRRWMIAPDVYSEGGKGIRIIGRLDPDGELLVENRYRYEYEVIDVDERRWKDNAYFVPIPQEEMNRNPSLVQNPGY